MESGDWRIGDGSLGLGLRAPQVYFVGDNVKNLKPVLAKGAKLKCSRCGLKGVALGWDQMQQLITGDNLFSIVKNMVIEVLDPYLGRLQNQKLTNPSHHDADPVALYKKDYGGGFEFCNPSCNGYNKMYDDSSEGTSGARANPHNMELLQENTFTVDPTVTESGIADQMRLIEPILNDQDFFQKLMELFRICEDLENMDGLHMIFKIVKGIILLNSAQIFEKIFGDELIMDIIGSFEYVPQVQHYRNFLKEHVVFKEDVVLARVLDEATVASLDSMIHSNNAIEKPSALDCSPRTICGRHIMAGSYLYKCIWEALQQRIRMILINMQLTPYVL
ncbi:hypothetical protein PVK06_012292 [Gossypium arboreum]|uniref:Serine/threonine-protein phosphatase 4 regulatory subunit 3-like central domain-containing protein n=1 Tax=Gossypium arboreum TaxID=29729 RepID=A0ABR0QAZ4_GOSAR|nr:hypothetical protein PVK06_012292 [Gossypium arboreum]